MPNNIKLYLGKAEEILPQIESNSVDLLATDPPYGISFMGKEWDSFNEVKDIQKEFPNTVYADKGFKKLPRNKPFGMTEFFVPIWKECLRVLKPGAFAFVMCAPRQDCLSKQIISLEEAGFKINFSSIYWTMASGFPKAENISLHIDKQECKKELTQKLRRKPTKEEFEKEWKNYREIIGKRMSMKPAKGELKTKFGFDTKFKPSEIDITIPTTSQAKELDGSYGGFQPKPAVEIIIVAMKPLSEKTYVDQALKNGKGITWLDNCRVPYKSEKDKPKETERGSPIAQQTTENSVTGWNKEDYKGNFNPNNKGRFPANLLVSDDSLNDNKDHIGWKGQEHKTEFNPYGGSSLLKSNTKRKGKFKGYDAHGSYSRYFDLDKWWEERIKNLPEEVCKIFPFLICPKASKSEKNKGCENLDEKIDKGSIGLHSVGISPTKNNLRKNKNNHPTVKPIKLMSYLITLGSREGDTVLDPFMGSGTTGISAKLLNRKFIGIEMSEEYIKIAQARIQSWNK